MKRTALLIFALFIFYSANCQTNIDSLKQVLNKSRSTSAKIDLLVKLSTAYRSENPQKALEYSLKARELCRGKSDDRCSANALMQVSICQLDLYDYKNALINIEKSIATFERIKDYTNLVVALNSKGRIFYYKAEYPRAIECYNRALGIAKAKNDKNGMSLSHLSLGLTYSNINNFEKSYENLCKSIQIDSLLNNRDGVSKGYNNLGLIFNQIGDYEKSLKYYSKAYEISLQLNNKYDLAKNLGNIGNIYYQTKNYRKALDHYFKSLRLKRQILDRQGIANNYNNIGATYIQLKKMDSTIFYFKAAVKIFTQINDKYSIGRAYANIGALNLMMGKEKEALSYLWQSIKIRREVGDIKGEAHCYLTLGELYTPKNGALALKYYMKSLHSAKQVNDESLKMECSLKISSIYEKQRNHRKALEFYQQYHAISDTIYNHQSQKQLLELQTKYEAAAKDNEIKMLSKNNEINRLSLDRSKQQLRQQRLINGVIVLGLLFSAFFGVFYFRMFRQKRRINQKLKEQNMEIEHQNQEISCQRDRLESLNAELEVQKEKVMNQRDSIEAELKRTLLASEILQRENLQFKFDMLKNQLNPHFLFNTLSTLISLIPENPALAERFTQNLSSVYLYILTSKDKELVKLKEEVAFINSYMFLISIRFNDNVKVSFDIDPEMTEHYLPFLSLQLLVENAIKHNVISERKPLMISIKSEGFTVVVQNNLQKKQSIETSTKIGLQNIVKRYELICTDMVVIDRSESHFTVKLPLVKERVLV